MNGFEIKKADRSIAVNNLYFPTFLLSHSFALFITLNYCSFKLIGQTHNASALASVISWPNPRLARRASTLS